MNNAIVSFTFDEVDHSNHVNSVEKFLPLQEHGPLELCICVQSITYEMKMRHAAIHNYDMINDNFVS